MLTFVFIQLRDNFKELAETEIDHLIGFFDELFITDEVCII